MAKFHLTMASLFRDLVSIFHFLGFRRGYASKSRVEAKGNEPKQNSTNGHQSKGLHDGDQPTLTAYRVRPSPRMRLVKAPSTRNWMDDTDQHFAHRCLPLLIANQAGWLILNSHEFCVTWTGGDAMSSLKIEYLSGLPPYPAASHFGYGIITWTLPYLFRTSPGYNLLVRGPANWPKNGAYPLEGIVETDWCAATFTMNWKITIPDFPLRFGIDEPICMLVPQRRHELETFLPQSIDIESAPEELWRFEQWSRDRYRFLKDLKRTGSEATKKGWQKDYFHGKLGGVNATSHQTRLHLREFDQLDESNS